MKKGFTLVELLVVVSVIAVLAAILYPVFATARMAANNASCQSNLHQIGLAMGEYTSDWDEHYPAALDFEDTMRSDRLGMLSSDGMSGQQRWQDLTAAHQTIVRVLAPYVTSARLWRCPADIGINYIDGTDPDPLGEGRSCFQRYGSSYLYRSELGVFDGSLTDVKDPTTIATVFDAVGYWHTRNHRGLRYYSTESDVGRDAWQYVTLWADGHVGWANERQIVDSWLHTIRLLGVRPVWASTQ